jgi:drug/metabolite transporter (DMT)-like permease
VSELETRIDAATRRERAGGAQALFVLATLIWGSTWLAIRYQLGTVAPEVSVAYRFALAAALLLGWIAVRGERLRYSARDHLGMAAQGMSLFGANYVLVYHSERFLASGLVAVVFSLIVFFNIMGMRVFFGRPVAMRMLVGAACGVVGVALLFWREVTHFEGGARGVTGLALAGVGTLVASLGNLLAQRNHRAGLPVQASAGFGMTYGALFVAAFAAARGLPWRFEATGPYVASLLYLAVFGSVVAFVSYLTLVARIGADRASYTAVAIPVVALALSTVAEGYRWNGPALVGVALCVAGNVVALTRRT